MSTVIAYGRRLNGNISDVYNWLIAAKDSAIKLNYDLQTRWAVQTTVFQIDRATSKGISPEYRLHNALIDLDDRRHRIQKSQHRDPLVDFDFEIYLFPAGSKTLCMVNCEQRELLNWFDDLPWVSEYAYWDNSDRDDSVTAAEWRSRKKAWNEVLPGAGVPSERCLTFKLSPTLPLLFKASDAEFKDSLLTHVPSRNYRIKNIASELHRAETFEALLTERGLADNFKSEVQNKDFDFGLVLEAGRIAEKDTVRRSQLVDKAKGLLTNITLKDLMPRYADA
jgi:hypothetical protein